MAFSILQLKRMLYLVFYTIYERWQLVFLPLVLIPIAVLVLSSFSEKKYVNHATILIEESALLNPFLDELEFSFELSKRMDALRTIALSRQSLSSVITETGLVDDPTDDIAMKRMQEKLAEAISISLVGKELVRFQLKWSNPEQMKPVLTAFVESFVERLVAPTKTSLDTSEDFLKTQLAELQTQLETSEENLANFKAKNRAVLPDLLNMNQESLSRLEVEKQEKLVELSGAKARSQALRRQVSKANPVLGNLNAEIMAVESDLETLRIRYTDQHSKVREKLRYLETLSNRRQSIQAQPPEEMELDFLWQIATSLPINNERVDSTLLVAQLVSLEKADYSVAQLENEIQMLESQVNLVTERLSSSTEIDKTLRQLQRDYQVKQRLYNEMLQRYEMSRVTGQLVRYEGTDKIKTIEKAFSPTTPLTKSWLVNLLLGLFLGGGCAVMVVFISMVLDIRVRDIAQLEAICQRPVLTRLPTIR